MFCCSSAWTTWTQSDKRYVNSSQCRTDIASAAAARRVWNQPPTVKMSDDDFRFTRGNARASHTHTHTHTLSHSHTHSHTHTLSHTHTHTHTHSVMSCTSGTSSEVTARGAHHRSLQEILLCWCCFVGLCVCGCECVCECVCCTLKMRVKTSRQEREN